MLYVIDRAAGSNGRELEALGMRGPHRLQRDHRVTINLGGAEDVHAVWMTDRGREPPFTQEPLALPRASSGRPIT